MPDFWSLSGAPFVHQAGWTLLHFVWQGTVLAALLAGVLRLLRTHAPPVRYAASCAALAGLLVLPIGTAAVLADRNAPTSKTPAASEITTVPARASADPAGSISKAPGPAPSLRARAVGAFRPLLPWIVGGWAVGVLGFAVRLGGGAWRARRLRHAGTPVPRRWKERLGTLARRMGISRTVALRRSSRVESPLVTGWLRPVVLVPTGLLSGLPPEQVEALLLHELAHVRRHDVLVARLQAAVETLLFFHPATWWISRQVRRTRESCCDDWAVRAGAGRGAHARALASLAERMLASPQPSTGTLMAGDGPLLRRIRRLLTPPSPRSTGTPRLSMAATVLLLVGVPLALAACVSMQPSRPSVEQSEKTPRSTLTAQTARVIVATDGDSTDHPALFRGPDGPIDTLAFPLLDSPHSTWVHIDPDSLLRSVRAHIDFDRLQRRLKRDVDPNRLRRVLRAQVSPDSLKQTLRGQLHPDSLRHAVRREITDSLGQALREQLDIDRLAQTNRIQLGPPQPSHGPAPLRSSTDSTVGLLVGQAGAWTRELEHSFEADSLLSRVLSRRLRDTTIVLDGTTTIIHDGDALPNRLSPTNGS